MARAKVDWAAIPDETWRTRTNAEIARELGVSRKTVRAWRKRLDRPSPSASRPPVRRPIDWTIVTDTMWRTRRNTEIALVLRADLQAVKRRRADTGQPPEPRAAAPYARPPVVDRATVRVWRTRLAQPASAAPRENTPRIARDDISDETWRTRTNAEIAREFGLDMKTVGAWRAESVEWEWIPYNTWAKHTNGELGQRFRVSENTVAHWRERVGAPDASAARWGTTPTHSARQAGVTGDDARPRPAGEVALATTTHVRAVNKHRRRGRKPEPTALPTSAARLAALSDDDWRTRTNAEIAREVGVSEGTVHNWRKRLGQPSRPRGRRAKVDWAAIPEATWRTRTNAELAAELGVSVGTVHNWRKRLGQPSHHQGARAKVDWAAIPDETWRTGTNAELARELGVKLATVTARRRELGKPKAPRRSGEFDWAAIPDETWATRTNAEIAQEVGLKPKAVRAWRQRLGRPPAPRRGQAHPSPSARLAALSDDVWRTRPVSAIARAIGVSTATVSVYRRQHRKPHPPNRNGRRVDWDAIPDETWATRNNRELARELGVSGTTVGWWRKRIGTPRLRRSTAHAPLDWAVVTDTIWRTERDTAIARMLGTDARTVARRRAEAGRPMLPREELRRTLRPTPTGPAALARRASAPPPRRRSVDWEAIPDATWRSLANAELAQELGVSHPTVLRWRKKLGKPDGPARRRRRTSVDWEAIADETWATRTNGAIARELGVSASAVHQWRHRLGKPTFRRARANVPVVPREAWRTHAPPPSSRRGSSVRPTLATLSDDLWASRTDPELARLVGEHHRFVRRWRTQHGKPPAPRADTTIIEWDEITDEAWRTTNDVDLGHRLGLLPQHVKRWRVKLGKPEGPPLRGGPRDWDAIPDEVWATHTDFELGRKLGNRHKTVREKRARFGKPAAPKRPGDDD